MERIEKKLLAELLPQTPQLKTPVKERFAQQITPNKSDRFDKSSESRGSSLLSKTIVDSPQLKSDSFPFSQAGLMRKSHSKIAILMHIFNIFEKSYIFVSCFLLFGTPDQEIIQENQPDELQPSKDDLAIRNFKKNQEEATVSFDRIQPVFNQKSDNILNTNNQQGINNLNINNSTAGHLESTNSAKFSSTSASTSQSIRGLEKNVKEDTIKANIGLESLSALRKEVNSFLGLLQNYNIEILHSPKHQELLQKKKQNEADLESEMQSNQTILSSSHQQQIMSFLRDPSSFERNPRPNCAGFDSGGYTCRQDDTEDVYVNSDIGSSFHHSGQLEQQNERIKQQIEQQPPSSQSFQQNQKQGYSQMLEEYLESGEELGKVSTQKEDQQLLQHQQQQHEHLTRKMYTQGESNLSIIFSESEKSSPMQKYSRSGQTESAESQGSSKESLHFFPESLKAVLEPQESLSCINEASTTCLQQLKNVLTQEMYSKFEPKFQSLFESYKIYAQIEEEKASFLEKKNVNLAKSNEMIIQALQATKEEIRQLIRNYHLLASDHNELAEANRKLNEKEQQYLTIIEKSEKEKNHMKRLILVADEQFQATSEKASQLLQRNTQLKETISSMQREFSNINQILRDVIVNLQDSQDSQIHGVLTKILKETSELMKSRRESSGSPYSRQTQSKNHSETRGNTSPLSILNKSTTLSNNSNIHINNHLNPKSTFIKSREGSLNSRQKENCQQRTKTSPQQKIIPTSKSKEDQKYKDYHEK